RPGSSLFGNVEREKLKRKRSKLLRPVASTSSVVAEAVTFVLLVFPLFVAFVEWLSGHGADVDLFRVGFNLAASLTLSGVWLYLRKMNLRAGLALQEEIDRRNEQESKHAV